jgi:hypothetical protein
MKLCLHDLAELTGGKLRLAAMPPREGELARVQRFVLNANAAGEGDVYWCLGRRDCSAELAYFRGALGVVVVDRQLEPWPGRFSLLVDDPVAALRRLVKSLIRQESAEDWPLTVAASPAKKETSSNPPELKGLQLCAGWGVDIYSPTCGQSANELQVHRCRRRAA